jgi:opacity protein-like surface antigen
MRQLLLLGLCIVFFAATSLAQGTDDYNKWEVYGGYSLARVQNNITSADFTSPFGTQSFTDLCSSTTGAMIGTNSQRFFCERANFHGLDTSVTYNFSRYVGLKGDFTAHFKSSDFVDVFTPPGVTQTLRNRERIYNVLGGVQLKDNSRETRFKPFGHVLAGVARYTNRQEQILDLFPQFNFTLQDTDTSFAMKLGGGLDIRASDRIDIRVFEVDYNPIFAGDRSPTPIAGPFTAVSLSGRTTHNLVFGVGIVIH